MKRNFIIIVLIFLIIILLIYLISLNNINIEKYLNFNRKEPVDLKSREMLFYSEISQNHYEPRKKMTESNIKYDNNDLKFTDYMDILM
jgi:hypothetical protein